MFEILGISGKKQSGKNTMANYINGLILKRRELIDNFYLGRRGELIIVTKTPDGKEEQGLFDVTRKDDGFVSYAEMELWPYVKVYSFADGLKKMCIKFFNMKPEQVYGTDAQKNTPVNIKHEDMPDRRFMSEERQEDMVTGFMSAREFMQDFGTNIMRQMYEPIWVESTIKTILSEQTKLAIIADVRFPNEVKAIQDNGGKVIRLTRDKHNDYHHSECALDEDNFDWSNFDVVIDNSLGGVDLLCKEVDKLRSLWGG